jgi:excisionase family DNA binding protein
LPVLMSSHTQSYVHPRKREHQPPLLLRIRDVAALLSMSESGTYDLVYRGELPSVYIGSARRIRMSDLEAYIAGLPSNSA